MMKNYISLIIACLFIQVSLNAQIVPCENGKAGDFPCNDYDLMSRVSSNTLSGSGAGGNDIWGWTDPTTNNEYAIMGMTNSTAFVDITDPVNPIFLGRLNTATSNSSWRDIKVYDHYAFIVSEANNHGMQVFDLHKLRRVTTPQNFSQDARFTGVGGCHNIVINESEAFAYLVGCRSANGGGPIFIDISDPLNPREVGEFRGQGYSHDAQVVTYFGPDEDYRGREIYVGSNENEVIVADVTNKSNPRFVSDITYPQRGYTHQGWFTEDQRYFILGDETDEQGNGFNTKTLVFDMVDLDNPKLVITYFGPTKAIDHNGYVKGDKYYLANYRAGMRVIDISDIASGNIEEVGFFDGFPSSNSASFSGTWSVYPYFPSGNIVMSEIGTGGMLVVRQSNTLSTDDYDDIDQNYTLLPNPTSSNATIKAAQNAVVNSVEIFNVLGQNMFKKENINQNTFVLPMSSFSKGIYLIKINDRVTKKLVLR